jgi:ABC-type dipeptide/oligopeptide/nickel transport system permease subunit
VRRFLVAVAGALLGAVAGYFIGVHVACDWLYPTSNLCGIYGVFITAPIGLACGAVSGWVMGWPRSGDEAQ